MESPNRDSLNKMIIYAIIYQILSFISRKDGAFMLKNPSQAGLSLLLEFWKAYFEEPAMNKLN